MKLNIKGTIISNSQKLVYDWWHMDSCCPADVEKALEEAHGGPVDVYINSGGGLIWAGTEIYEALKAYQGGVKIHVVGLAGSAASVILCAAESDITPTSMVMIHNVSAYAEGAYTYLDHERDAECLKKASQAMRAAYEAKTGKSGEELQQLMDRETWFTAQEAVDMGLCNDVTGSGTQMVAAVAPIIPDAIVRQTLDMIAREKTNSQRMAAASARFAELEATRL